MGWFARVSGCSNMFLYGAGFWTFFNNNDGSCQKQGVCQTNAINIRNTSSINWFGINVKDNVNVIDNDGAALVTESNNPGGAGGFGKNGAVVGAFLMNTTTTTLWRISPPLPRKYEQAVYWGQDTEKGLANYCQESEGIDIIVLSFLNTYGNGQSPGGSIGDCTIDSDGHGNNCNTLANDISACQSAGKKVFLGMGGAAADHATLTSQADAEGVAFTLWNSYANPEVTSSKPRTLGNVFVNGWDLDIEHNPNGNQNYKYLVTKLRSFFPSDSKNTYYISGAPQCPLPEQNMGEAIDSSKFDYLFIQYYNSGACAAYQVVRPDGNKDEGFNFDAWETQISSHASAGAKLLIGLPAGPQASNGNDSGAKYFLSPQELETVVNDYKSHTDFAGVMLWDAGNSDQSTNSGCTYDQEVRKVLDTGSAC